MTACPPHLRGVLCDWPVCDHGKVQPSTRECICNDGWALPDCTKCIPSRWGSNCDREYSKPRASLPTVPYLPEVLVFIIISIIFIALAGMIRQFCKRGTDREISDRIPPPPYEVIAKYDQPPPYAP
ncbi:hypothetical protein PRIPAC_80953 [Pristionchus pacificus]|uniref:Uncharacterized protein n=1 Tax=Pristionchus pacificus TaxID=54126 RepID=A0A2A6CB79_PRIPA|nr:hypothetical protein PRIPAC_80953 [Pristionchus pacificus]|eukprot:PDM75389.1 hypothetical protein PRIPAC_42566 [Pristionchus pacificus]